MIILEESPWYQEIIRRGEQRERARMLLQMLQERFGSVSPALPEQLATLDMQTLHDLVGPAITLPSLEEFLQVLEQQTAPEEPDSTT